MLLSKRETGQHASGNADEAHFEFERVEEIDELRCGRPVGDADRDGEPRLHSGPCDREPGEQFSEAGLDLFRSRSWDPESLATLPTAGLMVKEVLDELELDSFPKTSGSRGLHVFVPIRVGPSSDDVLVFAEKLVARLAAEHPKELTVEHAIADRGNRVYLDPFRNGAVQTVVTPYSVRRKPHAPFSMPLAWAEVKPSLDPTTFNLGNFRERLKRKDPWSNFFESRQNFAAASKRLNKL